MKSENREEKKYFQKLGILPTNIETIKKIIKQNIKNTIKCWTEANWVEKQTFSIKGPAGVGKTFLTQQIADELTEELGIKFEHLMIKAPVLSRDDFLCPFPIIDNGKSKFKMLYSDFVPDLSAGEFGLFVIDELSRGDSSLQQLLWQAQNESQIHMQKFPRGWFVICLDNPDDQEYSMNYMEDAAGLRRVLHMYVDVSVKEFLNYGVKNGFHPLVIEFIQIHPEYLYDFNSQKIGMIYSNPASWHRVSNILLGFTHNEILERYEELSILFSGLLNSSMARMFLSFIKDKKDISPKDIFYNYDSVKNEIKKLTDTGNNIKLSQLIESFTTFLSTSKPVYQEKELKNIATFLIDIPADISVLFISKSDFDRKTKEFEYMSKLHVKLVSVPEYRKKYYESMVGLSEKAVG